MVEAEKFDAIVIGAGQGGGPLATALAQAGRKTALIEREHAGGTCVNVGCTPTKTMVASERVAYLARRAADYGIRSGQVTVDLPAVRQRKRDVVESFRSGSESRIEKTGGLAILIGARRVSVGRKRWRCASTTAASGACPPAKSSSTPAPALSRHKWPASNRSLRSTPPASWSSTTWPAPPRARGRLRGDRVRQMFRRFGSQVTMVQRGGQLLAHEDPDVVDEVVRILREDGIEILLAGPRRLRRAGGGRERPYARQRARGRTRS